jgi:hypothetical protein
VSPELHRALVPKTTIKRLVNNHVKTAFTSTLLVGLWLETYLESLKLFWGGHRARGRQAGTTEE